MDLKVRIPERDPEKSELTCVKAQAARGGVKNKKGTNQSTIREGGGTEMFESKGTRQTLFGGRKNFMPVRGDY